ncbi:glycosyltransferase family 55 protein [Neurospora crassa]|nr:glycosyltransferase family 55 protein [Neurospora crassa]
MHLIEVLELDAGSGIPLETVGSAYTPQGSEQGDESSLDDSDYDDLFSDEDEDMRDLESDTDPEDDESVLDGVPPEVTIPQAQLDSILGQMAVIVPCKGEDPNTIEGVLSGIPRGCLIVLVSNSEGRAYRKEVMMLRKFCRHARPALAIHQSDAAAAAAFNMYGLPDLVTHVAGGSHKRIRNGKGEGMMLGIALVAALCPQRRYVAFVDADITVPGAVNEYCRAFAAGFALNPNPGTETMVRLRWASKPKVRNGEIDYTCEGRSSQVVNRWLNKLLSAMADADPTGSLAAARDSEIIVTGNAGEHAMTMDLALSLRLANGYAIEPFHFVELLDQLAPQNAGGGAAAAAAAGAHAGYNAGRVPNLQPVTIMQIRTRNPHFHRVTDDSHVRSMWASGLGSIYHHLPASLNSSTTQTPPQPQPQSLPPSPPSSSSSSSSLTAFSSKSFARGEKLRGDILDFLADNHEENDNSKGELVHEPPRPRIYPPVRQLDLDGFREMVRSEHKTLYCLNLPHFKLPRPNTIAPVYHHQYGVTPPL